MASLELEGNVLVAHYSNGKTYRTGVTISKDQPDAIAGQVAQAVKNAKDYAGGRWGTTDPDVVKDAAKLSPGSITPGIKAKLGISPPQANVTPPPAKVSPSPAPPKQNKPARAAPPPPKKVDTTPKPEAKDKKAPPRPAITLVWIDEQLRNARAGNGTSAASLTHANALYFDQFIESDLRRSAARTDNQRKAAVSVFNALYQLYDEKNPYNKAPNFRLYLAVAANEKIVLPPEAKSKSLLPEFIALQSYLKAHNQRLGPDASDDIIRAAEAYIRYYLLNFVATNDQGYRDEITQLPIMNWKLGNVDEAKSFRAAGPLQPTKLDRYALMKLYLGGPIDGDTLAAALLHIRRWMLLNPDSGAAKTPDQIATWKAPDVIPLPEEKMQPTVVATRIAPQDTTAIPRIGVIGDSITSGGAYPNALISLLKKQYPDASINFKGYVSQPITFIRDQFKKDILDINPPYNTVIIQGGVNGVAGNMDAEKKAFTDMISAASARGMKVIVLTITPWSAYKTSNKRAQDATRELNDWLMKLALPGVTVVDMSPLGEGDPPKLRSEYDTTDPEHGLHPNQKGKEKMAELIAKAAYNLSPQAVSPPVNQPAPPQKSPLEIFADQNWGTLASDLANAAKDGKPADVIKLSRKMPPAKDLPAGVTNMETALQNLRRNDLDSAFDTVFNNNFRNNQDFISYCSSKKEYKASKDAKAVWLDSPSDSFRRRRMMRAVQDFLNSEIQKSGVPYENFKDDLKFLFRNIIRTGRDDIDRDGLVDVRMLAAISIYAWRNAHQMSNVAEWAQGLGVQLPKGTPTQEEQKRKERVITPF